MHCLIYSLQSQFQKYTWHPAQWMPIVSALLCTGCNGLFFYPDKVIRATPSELSLKFTESQLSNGKEKLSYWILHPTTKPLGRVLHFHGNAENMTSHFIFVGWLAKHGFEVVTFDYRGYGQSTGEISRSGAISDGKKAIDFFSRNIHDFYILGQSLGGAVALAALEHLKPENLRLLVLESTFASYRDLARNKLSNFFLTWPLQYPLSFLVTDEYSPLTLASSINFPVLMIHGDSDNVVPISEGEALFAAFDVSDKKFWRLTGAPHTAAFFPGSSYRRKFLSYLCSKHSDPKICNKTVLRFEAECRNEKSNPQISRLLCLSPQNQTEQELVE